MLRLLADFKFYPDQNKLIKEAATEITLSKKECELLVIVCELRPNEITKTRRINQARMGR